MYAASPSILVGSCLPPQGSVGSQEVLLGFFVRKGQNPWREQDFSPSCLPGATCSPSHPVVSEPRLSSEKGHGDLRLCSDVGGTRDASHRSGVSSGDREISLTL